MVRDSGRVTVDNNLVTGATVFGLTARGAGSTISGVGNVISGTGVRPVDTRAGASTPALTRTDTSGWAHHAHVTFFSYLEFHPLAALWLGIAVLILAAAAWSYRHRLPDHPYPASTRWRGPVPAGAESGLAVDAGQGRPYPAFFSPRLVAARPQRPASPPAPASQPAPVTRPAPVFRPAPVTRPQPAVARPQPAPWRNPGGSDPAAAGGPAAPPEYTRPQRAAPIPGRGHPAAASGQPAARGRPAAPARGDPAAAGRPSPRVIPRWAGPTTTTTSGCDRAALRPRRFRPDPARAEGGRLMRRPRRSRGQLAAAAATSLLGLTVAAAVAAATRHPGPPPPRWPLPRPPKRRRGRPRRPPPSRPPRPRARSAVPPPRGRRCRRPAG